MNFIIEKIDHNINTFNIIEFDTINSYFKSFINNFISVNNISSLDYFVIAESEEKSYTETVKKYASYIGTKASITQDDYYSTVGKSLKSVDNNGHLHQAIIIKSSIWECAAYEYTRIMVNLPEEIQEQLSPNYISLSIVIHEIGHAIDNENQFKMFKTINTKIIYNLSVEYDEYIKQLSLSLWGEYYAEKCVFKVIVSENDLTLDKELDLIKCIQSYSLGLNSNALWERIYRILYFFVLRLAFIHQHYNYSRSFNYDAFKNVGIDPDYTFYLANIEISIINLYSDYPNWDSDKKLDELSFVIKEFFKFEQQRQQKHLFS